MLAHLAFAEEKVDGLHFTIYADNVSLWTFQIKPKTQEKILQEGFNVLEYFVNQVGLEVSAEKSAFVVAGTPLTKKWTAQARTRLKLDEEDISQCSKVKVPGGEFTGTRRSKEWFT